MPGAGLPTDDRGDPPAAPRRRVVPHRMIVGFEPSARLAARTALVRRLGATVTRRLPGDSWVLSLTPGTSIRAARAAAADSPIVAYSEPDAFYTLSATPDDKRFAELWALGSAAAGNARLTGAWDVTTGSSDTIVAVVDTGVFSGHRDLAGNMWSNLVEGSRSNGIDDDGNGYVDDFTGWDFVDDEADPTDEQGHGTHVAGTIGAEGNNETGVAGVMWDASIMPLRVLDERGSGTTSDIAAAFTYAAKNGASIVNASLSGDSPSRTLEGVINRFPETLFVVAAGNDASDNEATPRYPCNFPAANIVCVASTTALDGLSSFSNYGRTSVDLGAPGSSILSAAPAAAGEEAYFYASGTSMAAPHVAGAAGLVKSLVPSATAAMVKEALLSSVDISIALEAATASGGRLDVAGALATLAPRDEPTPEVAAPSPQPAPTAAPSEPAASAPAPEPLPVRTPAPSDPVMPAPATELPASPTPTFEPGPPLVSPSPSPPSARQVVLKLSRHLRLRGRIDGPASCRRRVPVLVLRNGHALATTLTNLDGRFRLRIGDRRGRYVARVSASGAGAASCEGARSVAWAHDHSAAFPSYRLSGPAAAKGVSCSAATPAQAELLTLLDAQRAAADLSRLKMDDRLSAVATRHSRAMARQDAVVRLEPEELPAGDEARTVFATSARVSSLASLQTSLGASSTGMTGMSDESLTAIGIGVVFTTDAAWITVLLASGPPNECA